MKNASNFRAGYRWCSRPGFPPGTPLPPCRFREWARGYLLLYICLRDGYLWVSVPYFVKCGPVVGMTMRDHMFNYA